MAFRVNVINRSRARKERNLQEKMLKEKEMAKLTPTQRINRLDLRLGKDVGAKKERARFTK